MSSTAELKGNQWNSREEIHHGLDITRPDRKYTDPMLDQYMKVEDYQKWNKVNEAAIKARMNRSFIAGAIFGVLILVAIVLAVFSIHSINATGAALEKDIQDLEREMRRKLSLLQNKVEESVLKEDFSAEFIERVSQSTLKSKLPTGCKTACDFDFSSSWVGR